jgi:hypothetical protein
MIVGAGWCGQCATLEKNAVRARAIERRTVRETHLLLARQQVFNHSLEARRRYTFSMLALFTRTATV